MYVFVLQCFDHDPLPEAGVQFCTVVSCWCFKVWILKHFRLQIRNVPPIFKVMKVFFFILSKIMSQGIRQYRTYLTSDINLKKKKKDSNLIICVLSKEYLIHSRGLVIANQTRSTPCLLLCAFLNSTSKFVGSHLLLREKK